MKISKYKDWEDKFFEGKDLRPEEELFVKEKIDHPYFSFLEEEKEEKMNVSFEDFLAKVEEPKVVAISKRKSFVANYWMAASLILVFGLVGLWTFRTPEVVEPSLISHQVKTQEEDSTIKNSDLETNPIVDENPQSIIAKTESPKTESTSKPTNTKSIEKHKTNYPDNIDRTMSAQDYNPNYVIVNGKPIYNEDEAIAVAENAINFFASNVSQTVSEAEPARNVSRELHQVINF